MLWLRIDFCSYIDKSRFLVFKDDVDYSIC
jgi:hypothetical protein